MDEAVDYWRPFTEDCERFIQVSCRPDVMRHSAALAVYQVATVTSRRPLEMHIGRNKPQSAERRHVTVTVGVTWSLHHILSLGFYRNTT